MTEEIMYNQYVTQEGFEGHALHPLFTHFESFLYCIWVP